jgi:D-sedoheptulose 7-phosphate isomerase
MNPIDHTAAESRIRAHLSESAAVKRAVAEECLSDIMAAVALISDSFSNGGKLLICGNGGSAADSQHLAAEFVSLLTTGRPRRALPAIALTTDTSFITARANDFGFTEIFSRQIEALARPGDVVIGLTTSGNSPNVIAAARAATECGAESVALTGRTGGALREHASITIKVPSDRTAYIQESHIAICHIICELVEMRLFGAADSAPATSSATMSR